MVFVEADAINDKVKLSRWEELCTKRTWVVMAFLPRSTRRNNSAKAWTFCPRCSKMWPKSFSSEKKVMYLADLLKTPVPASESSAVSRRFLAFVLLIVGLVAALGVPLYSLAKHVAASDLHSHILLIPFVSVYHIHWKQLPQRYVSSPSWAFTGRFAIEREGVEGLERQR